MILVISRVLIGSFLNASFVTGMQLAICENTYNNKFPSVIKASGYRQANGHSKYWPPANQ
jgi:hypothetical protein